MSWREIFLGDAIHIKHGFAFKSQYFSSSGVLMLLTPGNFHEKGGFRVRPAKERFYTGDFPDTFLLKKNDLIVAMTEQGAGLLGSSAWIPESDKYLHNQRLGKIDEIDKNILAPKYLYHLFNTYNVRGQISGSATGTKVRHTAPERIYKVKVRIPGVNTQETIASIIDAYDDLIENNRRRIQLLEESARLLYKEWFIHLRFPGHKHTKIIDGVPEGWERKALGECAVLNYGKALKKDSRVDGDYPVYGSSGIVGSHDKAIVKASAIILGRKGNVGSVYWSVCDCWPIDTVYYILPEESDYYFYYTLKNMTFINTDVAVPGLNRNFAYSRLILNPEKIIKAEFNGRARQMHAQIEVLLQQNQKLAQARDLLLPRLMNGEIEV